MFYNASNKQVIEHYINCILFPNIQNVVFQEFIRIFIKI